MVAIKDSVDVQISNFTADPQAQYVILICKPNDTAYTLVNIYAPNGGPSVVSEKSACQGPCPAGWDSLILGGNFKMVNKPLP